MVKACIILSASVQSGQTGCILEAKADGPVELR